MKREFKKSVLAMAVSGALAFGVLTATVEPSLANVNSQANAAASFEAGLKASLAALDKQSFSSSSAKNAAIQALISKQQKQGVLLLGAVVFALVVAAFLLVEIKEGGHGNPNPSPS